MSDRPRLGVSACLLGREVRHDGGHKRSDVVAGFLARHVELVAVCPEVEIGLPVPRNTLQLVGPPGRPRLIEGATGTDRTDAMQRWAARRIAELARLPLDGFAFKKGSPSCGVEGVPVQGDASDDGGHGSGLFAAAVRSALPALPLTEETRLQDPALADSFLAQLFTHHRLRVGLAAGGPAALPALHAAHRFLYMAHDAPHLEQLAQIASRAGAELRPDLADLYIVQAMICLAQPTSRRERDRVRQHILDSARAVGVTAPFEQLSEAIRPHDSELAAAASLYIEPYPGQTAPG